MKMRVCVCGGSRVEDERHVLLCGGSHVEDYYVEKAMSKMRDMSAIDRCMCIYSASPVKMRDMSRPMKMKIRDTQTWLPPHKIVLST